LNIYLPYVVEPIIEFRSVVVTACILAEMLCLSYERGLKKMQAKDFLHNSLGNEKQSGSKHFTIGSGTVSQATPQGRHHGCAEVGVELTMKRLPAQCLDH
jgi:hypothetical protein